MNDDSNAGIQGFAGVLPPITTPFDSHGLVDFAALERNLASYRDKGLRGLVIFGSNGEAVHLETEERRQILATVRQRAEPGSTLVAGVNAFATRSVCSAIEEAAAAGFDCALVITPYFYKGSMTQDVLRRFYLEVAEGSPLPILLYSVPQNTGVRLTPETIAELARHPRILGVKDSSGDLAALAATIARVPEDFAVLVGNAGILYPAMAMGATGGVLALACVAPEPCARLVASAREGDHEEARCLQEKLAELGRLVTAEYGVPGLKAALDLAGLAGCWPRSPLLPIRSAALAEIRRAMRATGFFPGLDDPPRGHGV